MRDSAQNPFIGNNRKPVDLIRFATPGKEMFLW